MRETTIRQYAEATGVSKALLGNYATKGQLPGFIRWQNDGAGYRFRLFDADALDKWFAEKAKRDAAKLAKRAATLARETAIRESREARIAAHKAERAAKVANTTAIPPANTVPPMIRNDPEADRIRMQMLEAAPIQPDLNLSEVQLIETNRRFLALLHQEALRQIQREKGLVHDTETTATPQAAQAEIETASAV